MSCEMECELHDDSIKCDCSCHNLTYYYGSGEYEY